MRQEVCASPRRGKGVRIDGVQAFRGKIAMFWDRKILASPCFGRRVELLPCYQAWAEVKRRRRREFNRKILRGKPTRCRMIPRVCERERPGVDTEQARSARGATALRCANARRSLVGARAPPNSPTSGLACRSADVVYMWCPSHCVVPGSPARRARASREHLRRLTPCCPPPVEVGGPGSAQPPRVERT